LPTSQRQAMGSVAKVVKDPAASALDRDGRDATVAVARVDPVADLGGGGLAQIQGNVVPMADAH
jgi:hypothetical protein